jgi:hypothetical protein
MHAPPPTHTHTHRTRPHPCPVTGLPELESGREVRDEFLRMIEQTKEYNAYEHDVDFEMSMVRRRCVCG